MTCLAYVVRCSWGVASPKELYVRHLENTRRVLGASTPGCTTPEKRPKGVWGIDLYSNLDGQPLRRAGREIVPTWGRTSAICKWAEVPGRYRRPILNDENLNAATTGLKLNFYLYMFLK